MRDAKIVRLFLSGIVLALAACSSVGAATAPVVTFTSPQFGQSFSFGATVTCRFTVTVSAGTILRVVVTNNHGTPDTLRQTPYTRSYSNLIPGYYVIEARVTTADTTVIAQQPFVIKPKAYPALPASPAANGKVKIFILAGQSNMVGMGELHGAAGARGTMDYYVKAGSYGFLVDSLGKPTKRNDVWVVNQSYAVKQGWLTAG
ncbi:MAG: sialate O-acetylesterase, partial [Chitinispirillaceae bacterium]|nr:sialate O-acetylesterase [Chitinispirillaceae bacterium]